MVDQNTSPQDPNQPQGPVYAPSGKETFPATVETIVPEKHPSPEIKETLNAPTPQAPQPQAYQEQNIKDTNTQREPEPETQVIDKTEDLTTLHDIKHPKDKLTDKADEEEEEFIINVQTAHDRN